MKTSFLLELDFSRGHGRHYLEWSTHEQTGRESRNGKNNIIFLSMVWRGYSSCYQQSREYQQTSQEHSFHDESQ